MSKLSKSLARKRQHELISQKRAIAREGKRRLKENTYNAIKTIIKDDSQAHKDSAIIDNVFKKILPHFHDSKHNDKSLNLKRFINDIYKKSPRVINQTNESNASIYSIFKLESIRSIDTWVPVGKGYNTQIKSLAKHLFAKYPVPDFIWSVILAKPGEIEDYELNGLSLIDSLKKGIVKFASGESFYKIIKEFFPLNKKQCHELLKTPSSYYFLDGVRRMQVKTHGGSEQLFIAWCDTRPGRNYNSYEIEVFWDSVIAFLAKNPMLDLNQVNPLIDYIDYKRDDDNKFSMKGRTIAALIRDMNEWHNDINAIKNVDIKNYKPSGFHSKAYNFKYKDHGKYLYKKWKIEEILTSKRLLSEGQHLHHCVFSYERSIISHGISIWSLTQNEERKITIEVHNSFNKIGQTLGNYNRPATIEEFKIINKWAQANKLTMRADWV